VYVELAIELIHTPCIEKDQNHECIHRTLLCEPESEFVSSQGDIIQGFDQDNSQSEGHDKPDSKATSDKANICLPVCLSLTHSVIPLVVIIGLLLIIPVARILKQDSMIITTYA
jgi:hypothetical protein